MSRKPDKAARRKAKLKARKAHAELHRLHLSGRIADALMDVSFPKRSYCMATIIRKEERDFQPHPGRMDGWRLMTDMSRQRRGLNPQYLNFDMRELPPHQYNAAYHFHRFAEELFLMLTGSATLRTPEGLTEVHPGDMLFFEAGETGAHQLCNHTDEPCTYLDLRSFIGHDVCEYPDSGKLILIPTAETFCKDGLRPVIMKLEATDEEARIEYTPIER